MVIVRYVVSDLELGPIGITGELHLSRIPQYARVLDVASEVAHESSSERFGDAF